MKLEDFEIGKKFYAHAGFEWLCTDKGTRTITAIRLDPNKDDSWFIGPPYAVEEVVWDEYDMLACYTNLNEMLNERIDDIYTSSHPNFLSEDVFKMIREKDNTYPHQKLIQRDRVGTDGSIFHPYSAVNRDGIWYIKVFEIFTKQYKEIIADIFIKLNYSTEDDMKKRKLFVESNK